MKDFDLYERIERTKRLVEVNSPNLDFSLMTLKILADNILVNQLVIMNQISKIPTSHYTHAG